MSRIGKKPIALPAGVEITVDADNLVTVKGPKGTLQEQISKLISVEVKDNEVVFTRGCLLYTSLPAICSPQIGLGLQSAVSIKEE